METQTVRKKTHSDVRSQNPAAFEALSAILFQEDPLSINFDINPDEYHIEAEKILPRLGACYTVTQIQSVVHEEFLQLFGADIAGPREHYEKIARRIRQEFPNWFPVQDPSQAKLARAWL